MPGIHNVLNALSVIAVADELEVPEEVTRKALAEFGGVQRRFTIVGETKDNVTVVDDYGHHPAEVQATLEAAQRAYGRRIVVAFQPHRYSRTQSCFEELTRAFNRADVLLLLDVYAAGEAPIEGATSDKLADAIRRHGHRDVTWIGARATSAERIAARILPGDVVITLGAGDITRTGPELLARLAEAAKS
jgi:UDP-N-acetylmuramate--alanine ligase